MTITALIGALVALLPRPERPAPEEDLIDRQRCLIDKLNASHARLVDHIERLERELLTEQHLTTHWREAAQRIAKQSREYREQYQPQQLQAQQLQALAYAQARALAYAQQNTLQAQAQQAQLAQNAGMQNAQAFGGYCNCVPSRSQVWTEEQRRNLDAVGDRIAQLRP